MSRALRSRRAPGRRAAVRRRPLPPARLARAALLAALLAAPAAAQTFDPPSCDLELGPGEMQTVQVTVCLPGVAPAAQPVDIYFLSDATASMGPVIEGVQAQAQMILASLSAALPEARFGVGEYRDWPVDVVTMVPFRNLRFLTDNLANVETAMNVWFPFFGSDVPEAQLYALHRLAVHPEEEIIGWRDDAMRIVIWFGDSPGHEPICPEVSGDEHTLTRASVVADLNAAGISVLAIDGQAVTVFGTGLNAGGVAGDYEADCGPGVIDEGQADDVTAATGGTVTPLGDTADVLQIIEDAVDDAIELVDVRLVAEGDVGGFLTSIEPPEHLDIVLPSDPAEEVCVVFDVTFTGQQCVENQDAFEGTLTLRLDGVESVAKEVTIRQPGCAVSQCLMFAGFQRAAVPLPGGDPSDQLLTVPLVAFPVLLDDVPVIDVPSDPQLLGVHLFLQVGMFNPFHFPADPFKTSNGLDVVIGGAAAPYGQASGMQLWLEHEPRLGGTIEARFSIDGFGG